MVQITYQKRNGCIIQRIRSTVLPYKIGDTTSMGWKVLNIEYEYKNKFYSEYKYSLLLHKERQMCIKRKLARELYVKELKNFLYCMLVVLILKIIGLLLGI